MQDSTIASQSEELLDYLQDATHLGVVYCKPVYRELQIVDFQPQWANRMVYERSGLSSEVFLQKTLQVLFPDYAQPHLFQWLVLACESAQCQPLKSLLPMGDARRWVNVLVEPWRQGIVLTILEIPELEQGNLLNRVLDYSTSGMISVHTHADSNWPVAESESWLSNPAHSLPTDSDNVADEPAPGAFLPKRNGEETDHFQAIDQLVHLGKDLKVARRNAEEALRVRDIFLSNLSHEIRTPLNSILGFSEILADALTDPDLLGNIRSIQSAGHTLLKLINNVLDLTKLDTNQFELDWQPVSLEQVLESVTGIMGARAQHKGLTFKQENAQNLPPFVVSDSLRLTQVFTNLCENAIKFTKKGGVRLKSHVRWLSADSVRVSFQIKDTGIGIPTHQLPLIFDRYHQASADVTRVYGGTGLGLNIVQSLVQRMGGSVWVDSVPGSGSTFTVELPFTVFRGTLLSSPPTILLAPVDLLRPATVLLVEDNFYNQRVVEGLVKQMNLSLLKAANGLEALALLRRHPVSIIFMDLQMPLMDGFTTTDHIRNTLNLTQPIVALTASALNNEQERCLQAGMNDYIMKPFNRHQLMAVIQKHSQSSLIRWEASAGMTCPERLDRAILTDLYEGNQELLRDQCDHFESDWPVQCQLLSESLESLQTTLFRQTAHKFRTTLHTVGMSRTAADLKQFSMRFEQLTDSERNQQWRRIIDNVERDIAELHRYVQQVR